MKDTTIAVGLAKNVFEIAISREAGKVSKQLRVSRPKLVSFFCETERCHRASGRCAFYLFIRVMEITDILSQNVPLEDVQYLAGHSNPSGHTDL